MKKSAFDRIYDLVKEEEIVYSTINEKEKPDAIVIVFDQSNLSTLISIHPPTIRSYVESRKELPRKYGGKVIGTILLRKIENQKITPKNWQGINSSFGNYYLRRIGSSKLEKDLGRLISQEMT